MHQLIIKNARIARADGSIIEGDLACDDGRIAKIGGSIDTAAREILDAGGHLLMPGVIDPHVHFREPGKEYKEDLASGSRAAARGGVTSFLEMPNTEPPTIDQAALTDKLTRAAARSVVNYGFFIGATPDNIGALNTAGPTPGIKIFMGCSTGNLLVHRDEDLKRIFANGERLIVVHAEDEARIHARKQEFAQRTDAAAHSVIRDAECALRATERALQFSMQYRRPLHILHVSTRLEVERLRREKPPWVKAEAIPNHLFFNEGEYAKQNGRVQMNPPIRSAIDNAALWAGLHDGIIDFMGTDHAPHTLAEKDLPFPQTPSGMPGVETALPLMLTQMHAGKCTLKDILRWMCSGPAEAYRILNKGQIAEGWDADLTLVDLDHPKPVRNQDLFTKCRWSPYAGQNLYGWPLYTVVGGRIVFEHDRIRPGVTGQALEFGAR